MDSYPQDDAPTELELEEQRAGYTPRRANIFDKLQEATWMPGIGHLGDRRSPPSQDDQTSDPESTQQEDE